MTSQPLEDSTHFQELKRQIRGRLRSVLRDVPPEELERLVDQMARVQYKYEQLHVRPSGPQLVRDQDGADG